jgi:hypothetical protein
LDSGINKIGFYRKGKVMGQWAGRLCAEQGKTHAYLGHLYFYFSLPGSNQPRPPAASFCNSLDYHITFPKDKNHFTHSDII